MICTPELYLELHKLMPLDKILLHACSLKTDMLLIEYLCDFGTAAFGNFLQLTGVSHNNLLAGLTTLRSKRFNLLDYVHALNDLSKDYVLAIQPASLGCTDEELGAVGVGSGVSHGQDTWSSVGKLEVFILELVSIDRFASSSVVGCKITTLAHKVRDNSMEGRSLESKSLLACTKRSEILSSLRYYISPELHNYPTHRGAISGHVKVHASHL